ncbi:hypothetical protein [Corallococcus macrosporus]|uniref:Uncharacterized protein n=2 Tax=Myxococcaceae TaxID=31 RepID=A0A250K175_9BACT|nr:hypothetical protein [Corallococcus macrosporus]AEI68327.1 hypothetical protein LILAB_32230 [Corallococcus macrosporus]ATB49106.1 hypothetical protein MYMAC_004744 [Corallococcus macrosporus DSM 14697]
MAKTIDALEQLPPVLCPYLDADLDDAVAVDVADFHELRLLSALEGGAASRHLLVAAR